MWSRQPEEERAWSRLGVDGALAPNSLLVSVLNRGGNKLDYFLHVSAALTVAAVKDETEVTVRLELDNRVPTGEPTIVAGPAEGSGVGEGVYLGIVTVNVPAGTRTGGFDGVDQLVVAGSDGPTRVMGFAFSLERGGHRSIVARFRLPGRSGTMRVEPSARYPSIVWQSGAVHWSDTSARVVTWRS
jgi:hypothetical protein